MARYTRTIQLLLPLILVILVIPPASGYVFYVSDKNGEPLRWFAESVRIHVSTASSPDMTTQDLIDISEEALDAWNAIGQCQLPALVYTGTSDADESEFLSEGVNENLIVSITDSDVWASKGYSNLVLAMTTLSYKRSTGQIVDADISLNNWKHNFSIVDPVPANGIDLLNTLTHEVGHLLGLDHSLDPHATMFAVAPDGESKKRSLEEDDMDGVCDLYTPYPETPSGDFAGSDTSGGADTGGCRAGSRSTPATSLLLLFACIALLARKRRFSRAYLRAQGPS